MNSTVHVLLIILIYCLVGCEINTSPVKKWPEPKPMDTLPNYLLESTRRAILKEQEDCCGDMCTWENVDSMESYLPPFEEMEDEQKAFLKLELKNFHKKCSEIRFNIKFHKMYHLPDNSIFYEYAQLNTLKPRAIAILIENPKFSMELDDVVTCPSKIFGNGFVCGKINFLLLDVEKHTVLDTIFIDLQEGESGEPDCDNLPYSIKKGMSYRSDGDREKDGVAKILTLTDFDRDGFKTEFPVFQYMACGFNELAIIGYKPAKDKLQYLTFECSVTETDVFGEREDRDSVYQTTFQWMPNLPLRKLAEKDTLKYGFYGGHGMETGEIFRIWRSPKGEFVGQMRVIAASKIPEWNSWYGNGEYIGY